MNINLTLIGQAIAFAMFVAFCMKFVWPPLINAISERQRKIADGLNAAEKAKADLADHRREPGAPNEAALTRKIKENATAMAWPSTCPAVATTATAPHIAATIMTKAHTKPCTAVKTIMG